MFVHPEVNELYFLDRSDQVKQFTAITFDEKFMRAMSRKGSLQHIL